MFGMEYGEQVMNGGTAGAIEENINHVISQRKIRHSKETRTNITPLTKYKLGQIVWNNPEYLGLLVQLRYKFKNKLIFIFHAMDYSTIFYIKAFSVLI